MIARWPGKIQAGTETDHVSGFQDMFPTLAELAGAASRKTDGISIVPTLLGETDSQRKHPYLYWEFHEQGGRQAVLRGQWKGVRQNVQKEPNGPIELYNLSRDIGEERNVASEHPGLVAEMAEIMRREHVEPSD
jgi:arylsulfatase A-like enzyme